MTKTNLLFWTLVNTAIDAYKEGLVNKVIIDNTSIDVSIPIRDGKIYGFRIPKSSDELVIEDKINFINSLYTDK